MMTAKDFDILARELGWELHLDNNRITYISNGDYAMVRNLSTEQVSYPLRHMLSAIVEGCRKSNPRFKADKFYNACNAYAILADEIGNEMLDAPKGICNLNSMGR